MKDYTQYDYQTLVDRMTELLKNKEGWGDAYQSSMGQTLIQLMADVTDNLHYMLERRTLESFLHTAKLRSSVFARASELGYRPSRVKGHSGHLEIALFDENGTEKPVQGEVIIDAMTPVTYGGRKFYVVEPVYIKEGDSSALVKIREGSLTEKSFDIDESDIVFASYENIEESFVSIYNEGEEYTDVRRAANVNKRALSFLGSDDACFDIKYGVEGMRIVFGDGEFGKKPQGTVTMHYAVVDFLGEPVHSIGNDFSLGSTELTDFQDSSIKYKYTLKNTTSISGGKEAESIDSIRNNATAYHRSNGRAVTNDDYAFWMKQSGIGGIVDARAYGEEEFDSLVYNANNVYITYATDTGDAFTASEKQELLEYFKQINTSQAHVVFNQARNVGVRLIADVVKHRSVPISNAQAYNIVRNFMISYMAMKEGSIGGSFHLSDLIDALYDLKYTRNGVDYALVDYVKLSSDVVVPFDFPAKTNECFIEIDSSYDPVDGDEFILLLGNLLCLATVEDGDNIKTILTRMRDVISAVTPFEATVQLSGVALDVFGNPSPIEIEPSIGYHLLIGADTPYLSPTEIVGPATIGSTSIGVVVDSPAFTVNHYYYSQPAGRRPMIPMRPGTTVTFTAPTDTSVKVYQRYAAKDPNTETLMSTLAGGEYFEFTSDDEHVLIFEYLSDSAEDVIAVIEYPDYSGVKYGIRVRATDSFGTFDVKTSSGDLSTYVSVDYNVKLPVTDYYSSRDERVIYPGSLRICSTDGSVIFTDNKTGQFVDNTGDIVSTGAVNYKSGIVTLPKSLPGVTPVGKYLIVYDQDIFENVRVSSSEVIQLIAPPPSADSSGVWLSELRVS